MNLQTFRAPTMAMALAQVKSVMGHDAVILHTRTFQRSIWLGLRRKEVVEITAGRGLNMLSSRRPIARATAPAGAAARVGAAKPLAPAVGYGGPGGNKDALLDQPAVNRTLMLDLHNQMSGLKAMVEGLNREVQHQRKPQIPEDLFDQYTQLVSNQVCDELAADIILTLDKQVRPEHRRQAQFVTERLVDAIERMIPTAGPIVRTKASGPHVVALIGPTGVGKTTTIAKLAANLKLREKHRVGLITIDTYRIAAIDQLKKYADILGSNLKVVGSPEDLRLAVESMGDCEFILIDTAGRSPNDTLKLHELKSFLAAAKPDEVHLVVSATASQECVLRAIERFGDVRCDRMIFTKLDEAPHVGLMLNIVNRVNKPLSYVTTGQDVPDDIEVGRGRRLANLILGSNL